MEAQLQALQIVANHAANEVNGRGMLLVDCLQDLPNCVREIANHGVHSGAGTALATVQTRLAHDLRNLQPVFSEGDELPDFEELVHYLDEAAAADGE